MKKMKIKLSSLLVLFLTLGLTFSCDQGENLNPDENNLINEETMSQFTSLGFDVSDLTTTEGMDFLAPEQEAGFLLEGDLVVSPENLKDMLDPNGKVVLEQYRTNNLVSQGRTINIIGYTGFWYGLDNSMRTALQMAVENFNQLNTSLNFTLTFGTNYNPYDIVVYKVNGSGGGAAGFPSGGAPYKWVRIQSGTSGYGIDVLEHVITHEIGHCVGLRHTDYFNRAYSCGQGGNEGDGGVGAIHIPGTPTGADANSIMLSCFNAGVNGEFGVYDRAALEYLY